MDQEAEGRNARQLLMGTEAIHTIGTTAEEETKTSTGGYQRWELKARKAGIITDRKSPPIFPINSAVEWYFKTHVQNGGRS